MLALVAMAACTLATALLLVEYTRFTGGFSRITLREGLLASIGLAALAGGLWVVLCGLQAPVRWRLPAARRSGFAALLALALRACYLASLALVMLSMIDHARYRALAPADDTLGSPVAAFAACALLIMAVSALADLPSWRRLYGVSARAWQAVLAATLAYTVPLLALLPPTCSDLSGPGWPVAALSAAASGLALASWLAPRGEIITVTPERPLDQANVSGGPAGERANGD